MDGRLLDLLDELHRAGREHDAALEDRLLRLRNLEPETVERGTRLILAAHWIERIGDRVTNVAEDVVYLATGQIEDLNP